MQVLKAEMNESFYCGDSLTSQDDLNNIYFKDADGNKYYQPFVVGRAILSDTVTSCSNRNKQATLGEMKIVSIPVNGYAYLYENTASTSPNLNLAGSYYSSNVSAATNTTAQANYSGQTVLDYFNTDSGTFVIDCQCSSTGIIKSDIYGGVTPAECGNLFGNGNPSDVCIYHTSDAPPNTIPTQTPYDPDVPRGYSSLFWTLVGITAAIVLFALIIMFLMIFGVFKSSDKKVNTEPPVITTQYTTGATDLPQMPIVTTPIPQTQIPIPPIPI